ncbi:hypothetical protein O181_131305 [Austropuccinia psidii MF-1]|uniref:Uncharacterized protein n=1 Tax=Austropuccinia psidii MF-1 TaxID=1389203 RepID=A0A9Q3QBT2_9BASI|nr:hypothetical protein [Austropuccinia psidii MF-1]
MLPTLLTIITLAECTPDMLPTSLILTLAQVPSRHAPDTAYPYACVVHSRHAPDITYPYARSSALPICSRHCLRSLRSRSALPTCSQHHLSLRSLKCPPDITYPYARSSALPTPLILTLVCCPPDMLPKPPILTLAECLSTCSRHDISLRFRTTSIVYGGLLAYTMKAIPKIC